MRKRRSFITLIIITVTCISLIFISRTFLDEQVGSVFEIALAAVGVLLVVIELSKENQITKAEFIYNLNDTFANNGNISKIYMKLKAFRNDPTLTFDAEDGRLMGDYVMFFFIMYYLLCDGIISFRMVNEIFANKFFIFMHHPATWNYQNKIDEINKPILLLYADWYNYRKRKKLDELYPEFRLIRTDKDNPEGLDVYGTKTYFDVYTRFGKQQIRYKKNRSKIAPRNYITDEQANKTILDFFNKQKYK